MKYVSLVLSLVMIGCIGTGGGDFGDDDVGGDSDADTDADTDADSDTGTGEDPPRATEIGSGDHSPASVRLVAVVDDSVLNYPTGIGFPSNDPGDLWIVNRDDDSWTIAEDVASAGSAVQFAGDPAWYAHFLNDPSAIAFSADEAIAATCNENYNDYNGSGGPYGYANDGFMGPVAWTTNRSIFDGTGMSHHDMLHESPWCMGIAWAGEHVFWVFNGDDSRLDRYDFHQWHPDAPGGLGGNDHSDGEIWFHPEGQVRREPDVPSHMVHDPIGNFVYVNDTGNGRMVRIDATERDCPATTGDINEPGVRMYECATQVEVVVPSGEMTMPSGLTLFTGATGTFLYATDFATGEIKAFTTDGDLVNWLDTGLGEGLTGIAIPSTGQVYVAHALENRVYRIEPLGP